MAGIGFCDVFGDFFYLNLPIIVISPAIGAIVFYPDFNIPFFFGCFSGKILVIPRANFVAFKSIAAAGIANYREEYFFLSHLAMFFCPGGRFT